MVWASLLLGFLLVAKKDLGIWKWVLLGGGLGLSLLDALLGVPSPLNPLAFVLFTLTVRGIILYWPHRSRIPVATSSRHIPAQVKRYVYQRDGGRCRRCGSRFDLQYDHIYPYSKGGGNNANNIQLLCGRCNRKKGAKS